MDNKKLFNMYVFLTTFSRNLIEVFIGTILYKLGFSIREVIFYYVMVNAFSLIIAIPITHISKKYSNKLLSVIGVLAFLCLQISLNCIKNDNSRKILKFITKIYHYNVTQKNGIVICPFIWNKNKTEEENIQNVKILLLRPDTRFPCSKFIKDEYYNNYPSYKEKAQRFTENYAMN